MSEQTSKIPCIGCGAEVPDDDYPMSHTEKYPDARSPGCWKIYTEEVLAREYGEWAYPDIHRLTVDAYACQHTGKETPQTTQSVNVHLLAIYLVLCKDYSFSAATDAMKTLIDNHKGEFSWLAPPENLGDMTIVDIAAADTLEEHTELVHEWARTVWQAWSDHHEEIEAWAQTVEKD
jgi:hypothetical protein